MTITCCPGCTRPQSRTACSAVTAEMGVTAACSKEMPAGFAASRPCGAAAYSANEPLSHVPYTSSPGRKRVTPVPTAATTPARSRPRTVTLGLRSPNPMARMRNGSPVMRCHTPGSTPAARTWTSTSSSPIEGRSMSRSSSTSAEPYLSWTIAFMSYSRIRVVEYVVERNAEHVGDPGGHLEGRRVPALLDGDDGLPGHADAL